MDGGAWWATVHGVAKSRTRLSEFTFTFHFHALENEMATHSSVLAWRIPGMGEPGGLPSMGSHRVGHDWSDLAAAAAVPIVEWLDWSESIFMTIKAWQALIDILEWRAQTCCWNPCPRHLPLCLASKSELLAILHHLTGHRVYWGSHDSHRMRHTLSLLDLFTCLLLHHGLCWAEERPSLVGKSVCSLEVCLFICPTEFRKKTCSS